MAPRGATRSPSPERRVLPAATYHLTDSVPQTAALAANRQHWPSALQREKKDDVESRRAARMLLRHPHADHAIAHKVWPSTSPFQDSSGLALPCPAQLILPANSSVPPFTQGSGLVTAPNTAHGRSGPAQLGHRLARFERVSPEKYERHVPDVNWDPQKYMPRPSRALKPEPEQSEWSYSVPEQLAAPSVRSIRKSSTRPNRGATAHGPSSIVMNGHRPRTTDDIFGARPGSRALSVDEERSWMARTPDGTTSSRQFRLETPDMSAISWARPPSPSREDEGGFAAKPKLTGDFLSHSFHMLPFVPHFFSRFSRLCSSARASAGESLGARHCREQYAIQSVLIGAARATGVSSHATLQLLGGLI